jgi:tRNA(His) guanylyltransferase
MEDTPISVGNEPGVLVESKGKRKEKKPKPYEGLTGDILVLHVDLIGDEFWVERPWLLA